MSTRQNRPTLRTIAELSGLAVPTVSRALNDAPDIGRETKRRVREIADQIGYVPNRAGLRLRTGKTNVISLVLGTEHDISDHMGQLVSSLASELRETRYHMIVTPYEATEDPMIPVRYIVETGSADAVILNRIEVDDARVAWLMGRKFPFVTFGRSKWRDQHAYFDFDNVSFGRKAATSLLENGHRNLVLISPPQKQNYAQDMRAGIEEVVRGSGAKFSILPDITADAGGEAIKQKIAHFLTEQPDVDGIIASSASTAMFVALGAESVGRTIGADLGLVGKQATNFLQHFRKPIHVVNEDVREAGTFLARAAIQAIEKPDLPPMHRLIYAE